MKFPSPLLRTDTRESVKTMKREEKISRDFQLLSPSKMKSHSASLTERRKLPDLDLTTRKSLSLSELTRFLSKFLFLFTREWLIKLSMKES